MNLSSKLMMRSAFAELKREERWNESMKFRKSDAFLSRLLHRAKHFEAVNLQTTAQEPDLSDSVTLELQELIEGLRRMSVEPTTHICDEEEEFVKRIRGLDFAPTPKGKFKPGSPSPKHLDAKSFTEVLQEYSTIESFVDFNDGDWLVSLKPKGTRALLVILGTKSILFYKNDQIVPIDFNPFQMPGKPSSQKGSIFDCYVNSSGQTSFITIMDVLILEGKPMIDLPAEVRYYFMYNNLHPTLNFSLLHKDLPPDQEAAASHTIHSSKGVWIGIVGLTAFTINSVKRLALKAHQTAAEGLILLNRQGEYKMQLTNEDAVFVPCATNKVHDYNTSLISMRFDKKTQSFCSLEGNFSIEINSSDLRMDWSFSNEEDTDDDCFLPSVRPLLAGCLLQDEHQTQLIKPRCYWKSKESPKEIRLVNGRIYSLEIDGFHKPSSPDPPTAHRASSPDHCLNTHQHLPESPSNLSTACTIRERIGSIRSPEVTVAVLVHHLASKQT